MRVTHRDRNRRMAEQFFHCHEVSARPRQSRRERMSEGVPCHTVDFRVPASLLETQPQVLPLASRFRVVEDVRALSEPVSDYVAGAFYRNDN